MANATMVKFGYPETLLADYDNWSVLLRPSQCTLGALVLVAKSEATAFSSLPSECFAELFHVVDDIETALTNFRLYSKINYLMLMMCDPHVHSHVFPRYPAVEFFAATSFSDPGWPGPPDLRHVNTLDATG